MMTGLSTTQFLVLGTTPPPDTIHHGTPQDGTMAYAVRIDDATGIWVKDKQDADNSLKLWTGNTIRDQFYAAGLTWNATHTVMIQITRCSYQNGGDMPDANSHENGLDFDIRYVRTDGTVAPLDLGEDPEDYDEATTQELIDWLEAYLDVVVIYCESASGLAGGSYTEYKWP